MAYTLQQLQQMGAKPVAQQSYSLDDLQKMGAQPSSNPSPVQQFGQGALNFAKETGKNILRGPTTMVARPLQLGQVGVGELASYATGDPKYADSAWNDVNTQHGLVKPLNQETPKSIGGEAATTVALGAIPGASLPVSGAIQGALGAGGSAAQDNASVPKILGNAALGGGLGYMAGKATQGLLSKLHGPATLEENLWKSGAVSNPNQSKTIQSTLVDNGISSLVDKEDNIYARNVLSNSLREAQNSLHSAPPIETLSGEPTKELMYWTGKVNNLQDALRAVTQVSHYITPGLIKRLTPFGIGLGIGGGSLASDTVQGLGKSLYNRFVTPMGPNPVSSSLNQ